MSSEIEFMVTESGELVQWGSDARTGTNRTLRDGQPAFPEKDGAASSGNVSWEQRGEAFFPIGKAVPSLPAGIYRPNASERGVFLIKQAVNIDSLITLPDSASTRVLQEIQNFRTMQADFAKHGFLFKRGVLLYGPPGSGKTSVVSQINKLIVEGEQGIALLLDHPSLASSALALIRSIEPNRVIVVVMEDLEALVERYGENEFLALLDGEASINNVVYLATTNYPKRLDKRFVNRPSRFDLVTYIGMPNEDARRVYFTKKMEEVSADLVEVFVQRTKGFSIAHLRELVILTQCFKIDLESALDRLNKMIEMNLKEDQDTTPAGFSGGPF